MSTWLDITRTPLKSSDYMSDELCFAIIRYRNLVKSKEGKFDELLTQQEELQDDLLVKQNELFELQTELAIILDQLDIAKATGKEIEKLDADKKAKEEELSIKQNEVDNIQSRIETVVEDIRELESMLAVENNFSEELLAERNQYIIERTWTDSNYIDDKELYRDAVKQFAEVKQPKTSFDFDIVSFVDVLEEQHNWDKLVLGDTITIKYEKIGVYVKAKITEINFNYDQPSIKLSIANIKDLHGDATKLLKMLKESHSSSLSFNMNKDTYDETVETNNKVSEILNSTWDAAKRRITAGVNETVDISGRGIIIRNPDFPDEVIIMQSGVLALSVDGGNTWKTAITGKNIIAETIMGKLIMGENMIIGDDEGTFEIKGNLLTIKDRQEIVRLLLGEYEDNKFGLKLMNKTGREVVLDENGILQSWQEGRTDNVDAANGLSLYIYLPEDTISVRQAILNFKLLPFRSYSRSTASGGATTQTSSSGGGTTATSSSGGGTSTSTQSGGGGTRTSSSGGGTTESTSHRADTQLVTGVERPGEDGVSHYHNLYLLGHSHSVTIGNHSHSVTIPDHAHNFTVPNHTHSVTIENHQHSVTIPAHTHDIEHGIYTSTTATGIGVIINGVNRTTALGGKFNADRSNLNITPYLTVGQWNEIRLTSERLGRIDASVFVQAFLST